MTMWRPKARLLNPLRRGGSNGVRNVRFSLKNRLYGGLNRSKFSRAPDEMSDVTSAWDP